MKEGGPSLLNRLSGFAPCPGNLYSHSGHNLGCKQFDLAEAVAGWPVDERVHANLDGQAREFIHPIVHGTRQRIMYRATGDEAHDVVEPANVLWLAPSGIGG